MKNNNLQDKDSLTGHHAIIMPPPNVTGVLHLGHALNLFMQDALVRFYRLQGKQIIWIPGTDHAGIATQLIVESQIKKEDNPGSQNLLERIWQWKEKSESNIRTQLEKMNLALDWEYYTFSLDDKVATAVNAAFHQLYNIGLIFRDKRMVNWDIELQTVLSDIETEMREVNGHMYYIKYRCTDGREIEVATTRPETICAVLIWVQVWLRLIRHTLFWISRLEKHITYLFVRLSIALVLCMGISQIICRALIG